MEGRGSSETKKFRDALYSAASQLRLVPTVTQSLPPLLLVTSPLLTTLPWYSLHLLNYLHSVAFSRCQLSVATSRRKSL